MITSTIFTEKLLEKIESDLIDLDCTVVVFFCLSVYINSRFLKEEIIVYTIRKEGAWIYHANSNFGKIVLHSIFAV